MENWKSHGLVHSLLTQLRSHWLSDLLKSKQHQCQNRRQILRLDLVFFDPSCLLISLVLPVTKLSQSISHEKAFRLGTQRLNSFSRVTERRTEAQEYPPLDRKDSEHSPPSSSDIVFDHPVILLF